MFAEFDRPLPRPADAEVVAAPGARPNAIPAWVDRALLALVVYTAICSVWMLGDFGGKVVSYYVGLLADSLPNILTVCVAWATARHLEPGLLRKAWMFLTVAHTMNLTAGSIGVWSWLHGIDPFPGIADFIFLAYYPVMFISVYFMVRAAAVRVPWMQIALDGTIFVVGFGAFFWFLVIRPAATVNEVDVIKHALSETYLAMNCVVL